MRVYYYSDNIILLIRRYALNWTNKRKLKTDFFLFFVESTLKSPLCVCIIQNDYRIVKFKSPHLFAIRF